MRSRITSRLVGHDWRWLAGWRRSGAPVGSPLLARLDRDASAYRPANAKLGISCARGSVLLANKGEGGCRESQWRVASARHESGLAAVVGCGRSRAGDAAPPAAVGVARRPPARSSFDGGMAATTRAQARRGRRAQVAREPARPRRARRPAAQGAAGGRRGGTARRPVEPEGDPHRAASALTRGQPEGGPAQRLRVPSLTIDLTTLRLYRPNSRAPRHLLPSILPQRTITISPCVLALGGQVISAPSRSFGLHVVALAVLRRDGHLLARLGERHVVHALAARALARHLPLAAHVVGRGATGERDAERRARANHQDSPGHSVLLEGIGQYPTHDAHAIPLAYIRYKRSPIIRQTHQEDR